MSFKIHNRKKAKICGIPNFDESLIENIRDEVVTRVNVDASDNEESGTAYVTEEKYYDYRAYFSADLRKAISSGYTIARVSIRTELGQITYKLFDQVEDQASMDKILATLYGKSKDNQAQMIVDDARGVITRSFISLINNINSFKIRNAQNLSDRELFGVRNQTVLIDPKELKKHGTNLQLAQKNINILDKNLVDSHNFFSLVYEEMMTQGRDPADTVIITKQETPADKRSEGCFTSPSVLTGNIVTDSLRMSAMKKYLGITKDGSSVDTSVSRFPDGKSIAVNKDVVDRVRLISHTFSVPHSVVSGRQYIWYVIDMIDNKGVIGQTVKMRINHRQNIEDYYTPSSIPDCSVSASSSSSAHRFKYSVSKNDSNTSKCMLFSRTLKQSSDMTLVPFSNGIEIPFRRNSTKTSKITNNYIPKQSGKIIISRVTPISKVGVQYGNFNSSVIKKGPYIPCRTSLCTYPRKNGIVIILHSSSPDVAGVVFEKRDVTRNERKFKIVKNAEFEPNDPSAALIDKKFGSLGALAMKTFTCVDANVTEGRTYEYRARLKLKYGIDKTTFPTRFQKFSKITEMINVMTSQPVISENQTQSGTITSYPEHAKVKISFTVGFTMAQTDSTKILEALSAAGLSDLYSTELSQIKTQLDNLVFFDVHRFSVYTGETSYLGSFPQGSTIVDDGTQTSALAPLKGQRYRYRVEAMLVAPGEAVTDIQKQLSNNSHSLVDQTNNLRNPQVILNLRGRAVDQAASANRGSSNAASIGYASGKAEKYYSISSMQDGTIAMSTVSEGILSKYPTGDYIDVGVVTAKNFAISPGTITFGNSKTGPVLRWQVAGDSFTIVDYFVVIAKKQGRKTIVGKCHCLKSGNIAYVDLVNKSFVGTIEYSILPVLYTGDTGIEEKIGTINIPNRQKIFRRSN
jgi:hypothetical protein